MSLDFSQVAFCKLCGQGLEERFIDDEERHRLVCIGCGHIHYINPNVVAGTIPVTQEGDRIWLLRRAIEPRKGFWTFPAGFMEMGESVEEAALRETKEELNLDVRIQSLLNVYSRPTMTNVHIVYLADAVSDASPGREALEIRQFTPDGIPWDELAFWSTKRAIEDWRDGR